MSIDYDEAYDRSRPGSPFSNGTMGYAWEAQWCARCLRDAPFRAGITVQGCPLLLIALAGRTPAEWLQQPDNEVWRDGGFDSANLYHCIQFRPRGGGGGGEPRPKPEPPDMDGLFTRPPRATRMFIQPQHAEVAR
ncbi:hypothetical protein D5S17_32890 [Pseudonocardiaceae bacterium YIM PH 21723]|nr:hypothetical protein D5S17_32890 [Pseudonocardiaceae bacterium YIM PH 21723]